MPKKPTKLDLAPPNKKALVKKLTAKKVSVKKRSASLPPPVEDAPDARILDRLWGTVVARSKSSSPDESHSARLLARGTAKVAQKFGEEAVECVIEAVAKNPTTLVGESADVLYHLIVLWVDAGLRPENVWSELERREGMSGLAEKAARKRVAPGLTTTKIP